MIYRNSEQKVYIGDNIEEKLGESGEIITHPFTYETDLANISQNYYLKHDVVNNVITDSYACIKYEENGVRKETCLRGEDQAYYAANQEVLRSVEPYFNTLYYNNIKKNYKGYCTFNASYSFCESDSLNLNAHNLGYVSAYVGSMSCYVKSDGNSYC